MNARLMRERAHLRCSLLCAVCPARIMVAVRCERGGEHGAKGTMLEEPRTMLTNDAAARTRERSRTHASRTMFRVYLRAGVCV